MGEFGESTTPAEDTTRLSTATQSSETEATQNVIAVSEFSVQTSLHPGLLVNGFTRLEELDDFINNLAGNLLKKKPEEVSSKDVRTLGGELIGLKRPSPLKIRDNSSSPTNSSLAAKLEDQIKKAGKHKFFGSKRNIRVLFLDPVKFFEDQSITDIPNPIKEDEIASFLVEADLYSSGKQVATVARETTMYVHPDKTDSKDKPNLVIFNSKPLNQEELSAALESRVLQSGRSAAFKKMIEGPHEVQGGLPSQGKGS